MSARRRSALLVAFTALAFLSAVAGDVAAAPLRWTDQTGDAHWRSREIGPVPALSEPAWDVTAGSVESDGKTVRWETQLLDYGAALPALVEGRVLTYGFRFEDAFFQLSVQETADDPITWFSGWREGPGGREAPHARTEELPCPDCRAWFDARRSAVVLTVSLDTLVIGIRRVIPNAAVGTGSLLEEVYAGAGPIYETPVFGTPVFFTHDVAPAPEPGSFRL